MDAGYCGTCGITKMQSPGTVAGNGDGITKPKTQRISKLETPRRAAIT